MRQFVDRLPPYYTFDRCTLGNFSLTSGHDRYILNETKVKYNGYYETPSHHFNSLAKDIRFPNRDYYLNSTLPYPYKFEPTVYPALLYLDVEKAYYQIAYALGLQFKYVEGRYAAYGATVPPQIFKDNKLMRALLVSGTGYQGHIKEWTHDHFRVRQFKNRNYAPFLRSAIIRVLHAVQSVVSPFTVYAHTDGFIIRLRDIAKVDEILSGYSIRYTVKYSGYGQVYGFGNYRIGDKSTRNERNRNHIIRDRSNIRTTFDHWWLDTFRRGVELRGQIDRNNNPAITQFCGTDVMRNTSASLYLPPDED